MKQVLIHKGAAIVGDVPAPRVGPGEVLVRVHTSCLSVGTEMSGVRSSAVPLWKKALKQPEKVVATLKLASSLGLNRTLSLIEEKRDAAHPTGYSAAGTVIDIGAGIHDIAIGDRVACAGAQCAHHAEFIRVPRNLCVPIPASLDWDSSSTVTLGSIALQGVRRATPTLGESFVVIGLGILGQLTVQLLKANGCRTIGIDVDPKRIAQAVKLGLDLGLNPEEGNNIDQVVRLTDGIGADGVIITAATPSDSVVSTAFKICRKKGRVVLVGDVGLHLNRADFYVKEIDFLISSSYGPGRYDHRYEEQGLDYPVAYVRWTENRNMGEYLRLLAEKRIQVESLITSRFPVGDATKAYASLSDAAVKPMMVLLTYPESDAKPLHTVHLNPQSAKVPGRIRIAILGAGAFARSAHLPNLQSLKDRFTLQAVVTRSGHTAAAIGKQFGANYCSTDFEEVLADPNVDAVIIATRHHQHGAMALAALKAGKHVLVEKPLVLTPDELLALDEFIKGNEGNKPVLLTGYNRRFSPYARQMYQLLQGRSAPFMLNYRMNAGYIPLDHWVHGQEGGGRNLGEACHIYDLFTYLANSEIVHLTAQPISLNSHHYSSRDNFMATLSFSDGSVASLTYTAMGAKDSPKETADLYVDGKQLFLSDYKTMTIHGIKGKSLKTSVQEKGLREELIAFADSINSGEWPIPWWQQVQSAKIGLLVEEQLCRAEMSQDFNKQ
ncbi:MAG: bi-domain-containing oxidoreductase [Legionella sp.]|nr:bi-domain-containing oxidoreductase [Legionella sp.]